MLNKPVNCSYFSPINAERKLNSAMSNLHLCREIKFLPAHQVLLCKLPRMLCIKKYFGNTQMQVKGQSGLQDLHILPGKKEMD